MMLKGKKVTLRALEPEDLTFLFSIENNTTFWEVSHTQTPFSKFLLKQYIENAHLDIYEAKQLRLIIEEIETKEQVGIIDLFDFNPQHKRAGVGIVIDKKFQKLGYASEAMKLLISYSFSKLNLHQLHATITPDNSKSISLFEGHNFKMTGEKVDWVFSNGTYKNELTYQLIHE